MVKPERSGVKAEAAGCPARSVKAEAVKAEHKVKACLEGVLWVPFLGSMLLCRDTCLQMLTFGTCSVFVTIDFLSGTFKLTTSTGLRSGDMPRKVLEKRGCPFLTHFVTKHRGPYFFRIAALPHLFRLYKGNKAPAKVQSTYYGAPFRFRGHGEGLSHERMFIEEN